MAADYFSLFSFSPAFNIDIKALEGAYFTAQRTCHPDRFVGRPAAERMAAMHRSADINKAYETLKDPLARAQYLLHLQGIAVGTEADSVKPSPDILMEAMELREMPKPASELKQMIDMSIARIQHLYAQAAFADMAQETLRLGYLLKARVGARA